MEYRVYSLDAEGHIFSVREITCADDEEAKRLTRAMLDGHDLEVWDRSRRVAVIKSPSP
ncbi:hypothetical protein [Bradyrhizobium zhanjiangense]|nr:hypothetical protein [Bradyrhizobium zhanjiangense]